VSAYKVGDHVEVAGVNPYSLKIGTRGVVTAVNEDVNMVKIRFTKQTHEGGWNTWGGHYELLFREVRLVTVLDLVAEAAK
jgi:hypothetical protein